MHLRALLLRHCQGNVMLELQEQLVPRCEKGVAGQGRCVNKKVGDRERTKRYVPTETGQELDVVRGKKAECRDKVNKRWCQRGIVLG